MKKLLLCLLMLLAAYTGYAQSIDSCGSAILHDAKMAVDPAYAQKMTAFESLLFHNQNGPVPQSNPTYVIPVVVHVMHKGEPVGEGTNLSDEAIKNQIKVVNENFRNLSGNVLGTDIGIEFALAVRSPQGTCTNGITRTDMSGNASYMSGGVKYLSQNGYDDDALKALDYWDSSQYYNIWVVSAIDNNQTNFAGYAYFASAHGQVYDGTIVEALSFSGDGNVTTHELGHALNLYHTFEGDLDGSACPTALNGCGSGMGDCVEDTAAHNRNHSCFTPTVNTCDPENTNVNYLYNRMNYSGCADIFTIGQKSRMVAALTGPRASYLSQNGNLSLTPVSVGQPEFIVSNAIVCEPGINIRLSDRTECIPHTYLDDPTWNGVSFNWIISSGENVYTYSSQNVDFVPTAPGSYEVSLAVTVGNTTVVNIQQGAVKVLDGTMTETCSDIEGTSGNFFYNIENVSFADINNTTAVMNNEMYQNYTCEHNTIVTAGESYPLALSVNAASPYSEAYRVYIDYNDNGNFENNELVMSGAAPSISFETYTASVTIPTTAVQEKLLTMRVIGEADFIDDDKVSCNASYLIPDVEDYGVYITAALNTKAFTENVLSVYPNPTTSTVTIAAGTVMERIEIYNMLGQLVLAKEVSADEATVDVTALSHGTYLLIASSGGAALKYKIIKK